MTSFVLDSTKDDHYVGCTAGNRSVIPTSFPNSVVVYKLKKKSEIMVFDSDWDTVTTVNPSATSGATSLVVNGFTVDVRALSQDICKHHLRVNWLGYCFQEPPVNTGRSNPTDPVNQFKRMNDMLNWLPYGARVNPQTAVKPSIRWNRVDIIRGAPVLYSLSDQEELKECREEAEKIKERVRLLEATKLVWETRFREIQNDKIDVENRVKVVVIENRNLNERNNQLEGENNRLKDDVARLRQMCNNRPVYIPPPPPIQNFVYFRPNNSCFNPCFGLRRC